MPKIKDDKPVTEEVLNKTLNKKLEDYPTKDDLKKILENYPTKNDLKMELKEFKKELRKDFPTKDEVHDIADHIIETLGNQMREMDDRWMTRFDHLTKDDEDLKLDNEVRAQHMRDLRKDVDDHDLPANA